MFSNLLFAGFAACYLAALVLEALRIRARGVRSTAMRFSAAAGWAGHTLYLILRATENETAVVPLSSWFDWYLLAAWLLAGLYLYLIVNHPAAPLALFVLPLVLLLLGVAAWFADRDPFPIPQASVAWGRAHGMALLLGTVAVSVGFIAGAMYLLQAARLKRKLPPRPGFHLPSLEWLERLNARSLMYSTALLGAGVISGIVLNVVHRIQDRSAALPWNDPVVWTSGLLFIWLVVAALFNVFYKPARTGRKVAYLTVASFVFLMLVLAVLLFVPSQHTAPSRGDATVSIQFSVFSFQSYSSPAPGHETANGRL